MKSSNSDKDLINQVITLLGITNPSTADTTTVMNFIKSVKDVLGVASPSTANATTVMNYIKSVKDVIGIASPSTADKTTIMNYIKVLENFLGSSNPSTADRTTLMNYNKLLEGLIGSANPSTADRATLMNYNKLIESLLGSVVDVAGTKYKPNMVKQYVESLVLETGVSSASTQIGYQVYMDTDAVYFSPYSSLGTSIVKFPRNGEDAIISSEFTGCLLAHDANYLYCTDSANNLKINKIRKSDLVKVAETAVISPTKTGGRVDGGILYVSDATNGIIGIDTATMTVVYPMGNSSISIKFNDPNVAICIDDTYIYTVSKVSDRLIKKYNKTTFALVATSADLGANLCSSYAVVWQNFIICGSAALVYVDKNSLVLSPQGEFQKGLGYLVLPIIDGDYVYLKLISSLVKGGYTRFNLATRTAKIIPALAYESSVLSDILIAAKDGSVMLLQANTTAPYTKTRIVIMDEKYVPQGYNKI